MPYTTLIGRSSCLENQTNYSYIAALNEVIFAILLSYNVNVSYVISILISIFTSCKYTLKCNLYFNYSLYLIMQAILYLLYISSTIFLSDLL